MEQFIIHSILEEMGCADVNVKYSSTDKEWG